MKKIAFTLAEIMITLTVIGIISAIILPIAINSVPDGNIMKFKKANSTLYQIITELVNSDEYYKDGDLGMKVDGSLVDEKSDDNIKYFCNTVAQTVSTKKVNCSTVRNERKSAFVNAGLDGVIVNWSSGTLRGKDAKEVLDTFCKEYTNAGEEIVFNDGVVFYQTNPMLTFGINDNASRNEEEIASSPASHIKNCRLFDSKAGIWTVSANEEFDTIYKIICLDIDGINNGVDPFGYGIRADGKILTGKRADEWLEKSIQGDE